MRLRATAFVVVSILLTSFVRLTHADAAAVEPGSCASHVTGDFNGDGNDDLAVGVPGQDVDGHDAAGSVHIFYGTNAGLSSADDQVITQETGGVEGFSEAGDNFGACLASGEFNGDDQADLAIGIPGENVDTASNAGAVEVVYGTVDGLDPFGPPTDDYWDQNSSGVYGACEDDDAFGSALGVGDFDGDGRDDLAIGAPVEAIKDVVDAGIVNVLHGAAGGLVATPTEAWYQDKTGVADVSERHDEFGASLAAGDFDGDGQTDLAVGVVGEAIGTKKKAGAVHVFYSNANGLAASRDILWHQDRSGVAGDGAETNDHFGTAVATGDFDADGFDDLAVGAPLEDIGATVDAGVINVLYGSDTGLNATGDQSISQNDTNDTAADAASADDRFGSSLAAADFENDGEGDDDLAVGSPGEDTATGVDVGAVDVIYGDDPNGLEPAAAPDFFTQDTANVEDAEEANDAFGDSVAAGDFNGDAISDLAIGVPTEDIGAVANAGAVNVIYGDTAGLDPAGVVADQFWNEDEGGVDGTAEADDTFGAAVG